MPAAVSSREPSRKRFPVFLLTRAPETLPEAETSARIAPLPSMPFRRARGGYLLSLSISRRISPAPLRCPSRAALPASCLKGSREDASGAADAGDPESEVTDFSGDPEPSFFLSGFADRGTASACRSRRGAAADPDSFRGREGITGRGFGAGDSLTGSLAGNLEEVREDEGNGEAEED